MTGTHVHFEPVANPCAIKLSMSLMTTYIQLCLDAPQLQDEMQRHLLSVW